MLHRSRLLARVVGAAASIAFACATGPTIHERHWIEVATPNFRIMSTLPTEQASELAIDLERFRAVIGKFTNAPLNASPIPTKIYAFAKSADFQRFTRARAAAGWMRPGMRQNTIALAEHRTMDSAQMIRHEYVHYVLHDASSLQYPTWYDEGFAEYLSTYKVRGNEELVLGTAQRERVRVLGWAPWLPIRRVLAARDYGEFADATELAVFYAEAWALVHYLVQGREGSHDVVKEMDRYVQLVEAGSSDGEAFEQAFGVSLASADPMLKQYLARKAHAMVFALSVLEFEPPQATARVMSRDEISVELGQLSLEVNQPRDAQVYFEAAIAVHPTSSRASAGLGDALKFQGLWEQAEPHFERAVELEPDNALNHLDLAEYLHEKARTDEFAVDRASLLKAARRAYARSQKLDPSLPETYAMYGATYLERGEDHARAIQTLEHANRLLPSNVDILMLLAKAYALNDRRADAERLVERYVAWSHSGDRDEAVEEVLAEFMADSQAESGVDSSSK